MFSVWTWCAGELGVLIAFTTVHSEPCATLSRAIIVSSSPRTQRLSYLVLLLCTAIMPTLRSPAVGVSMRTFPSGLIVLQLDSFSEDRVGERIVRVLQDKTSAAAAAAAAGAAAAVGAVAVPTASGSTDDAATASITSLSRDAYMAAIDLASLWGIPIQIAQQLLLVSTVVLFRSACICVH